MENITGGAATAASYKKISEEEAKGMMDDGKPYVLLDVRSVEEYKEQRIDGALSIPLDEIAEKAEKILEDKNARILVHCQSGRRSAAASDILVGLGYKNVNSFGGIGNWKYGTVSG